MRMRRGLGVSAGIVLGRSYILDTDPYRVARRTIGPDQVAAELDRFDRALKASIDDLKQVQKQAEREMGKETAQIFRVHIVMLTDKSLVGPIRHQIEREGVCAEYAVSQVFAQRADDFRQLPDPAFTTKVNDIDDLAGRLLAELQGATALKAADAPEGSVIIARDLTPSQVSALDRARVRGIATDLGGRTGHTSIIARALGIPTVVGCQHLLEDARHGGPVILDGDRGLVILDPDRAHTEEYQRLLEQRRLYQLSLAELAPLPAVTTDGAHVDLQGNIEFAEEIPGLIAAGGSGVGLYRTEFLYLARDTEPTEQDHFEAYQRCVRGLAGRPITIRTLDLGADKYTQSRAHTPERNPFLGLRSIRYCLSDLPMFRAQLRAILRASGLPEAHPGQVRLMFPLVTSISELRQGKLLLNDAMEDLTDAGLPFDRSIKVGMMVEVPSAALMAEAFAHEADFFSIGTNDLVQYTLAVDRTNERVAGLYNPAHPAVLQLIRLTVTAARRHGIPVSCCGEVASEPEHALLLMGLGVRTLSVTSAAIPTIKRLIRSVSIAQCEQVAEQALRFDSEAHVSSFLRDRARAIVPEAFDGRSAD
jgi:phosphotransferase system enzyme I (PtsI)